MKVNARKQNKHDWLVVTLVFYIILTQSIFMFEKAETRAVHKDENAWVGSTYYYTLVKKGDFGNEEWSKKIGYDHPPVVAYTFGVALDILGLGPEESIDKLNAWHLVELKNNIPKLDDEDEDIRYYATRMLNELDAEKHDPNVSVDKIKVCRKVSVLFGILASLGMIWIGFRISNLQVGLLSCALILLSPQVVDSFSSAITEPFVTFYTVAAVIVLMELYKLIGKQGANTKVIILSIVEGIMISLAVGSKFTGMPILFVVMVLTATTILITHMKHKQNKSGKKTLDIFISTALILLSASASFVLLNPFVHKNTIENTFKMLEHRTMIMRYYAETREHMKFTSLIQKAGRIVDEGLLAGLSYNYTLLTLVLAFIFLAGLRRMIREAVGDSDFSRGTLVCLTWILVTYVSVSAAVHMDQGRYYIPYIPCSALILAYGVDEIISRSQSKRN